MPSKAGSRLLAQLGRMFDKADERFEVKFGRKRDSDSFSEFNFIYTYSYKHPLITD